MPITMIAKIARKWVCWAIKKLLTLTHIVFEMGVQSHEKDVKVLRLLTEPPENRY